MISSFFLNGCIAKDSNLFDSYEFDYYGLNDSTELKTQISSIRDVFSKQGYTLLKDLKIPYEDNIPSFSFLVGEKYIIEDGRMHPYEPRVYLLGIVEKENKKELLVVENTKDMDIEVLSRSLVISPKICDNILRSGEYYIEVQRN
jgi:hypothetical protein